MVISRHGFGFHSLALSTLFFSPTVSEWKKSLFWTNHPERQNYRKHLSWIFFCFCRIPFPNRFNHVVCDCRSLNSGSLITEFNSLFLDNCLVVLWSEFVTATLTVSQNRLLLFNFIGYYEFKHQTQRYTQQINAHHPQNIFSKNRNLLNFSMFTWGLYLPTIFQMPWHFTNTSPVF